MSTECLLCVTGTKTIWFSVVIQLLCNSQESSTQTRKEGISGCVISRSINSRTSESNKQVTNLSLNQLRRELCLPAPNEVASVVRDTNFPSQLKTRAQKALGSQSEGRAVPLPQPLAATEETLLWFWAPRMPLLIRDLSSARETQLFIPTCKSCSKSQRRVTRLQDMR